MLANEGGFVSSFLWNFQSAVVYIDLLSLFAENMIINLNSKCYSTCMSERSSSSSQEPPDDPQQVSVRLQPPQEQQP